MPRAPLQRLFPKRRPRRGNLRVCRKKSFAFAEFCIIIETHELFGRCGDGSDTGVFCPDRRAVVNLFERPDWRNVVDIALLAILIYSLIKLGMHTRANSLFKGIVLVLLLAWLADALQISAVSCFCSR